MERIEKNKHPDRLKDRTGKFNPLHEQKERKRNYARLNRKKDLILQLINDFDKKQLVPFDKDTLVGLDDDNLAYDLLYTERFQRFTNYVGISRLSGSNSQDTSPSRQSDVDQRDVTIPFSGRKSGHHRRLSSQHTRRRRSSIGSSKERPPNIENEPPQDDNIKPADTSEKNSSNDVPYSDSPFILALGNQEDEKDDVLGGLKAEEGVIDTERHLH
mmetsp:Transcript_15085/g.19318  ORF Transcript_15085/g.19318 Transcript_15085/m.19318 type:complete len:215 (-) Transcript_15085:165-809(-)